MIAGIALLSMRTYTPCRACRPMLMQVQGIAGEFAKTGLVTVPLACAFTYRRGMATSNGNVGSKFVTVL